jgi:hypothetical protein
MGNGNVNGAGNENGRANGAGNVNGSEEMVIEG